MNAHRSNTRWPELQEHQTQPCWLAVHNPGVGIPILFLHGYPLDSSFWSKQVDHFCRQRTVLALDFRGFGKSPASIKNSIDSIASKDYTMASLADDCIEALDAAGVRRPIVVCGLSMGGYVALEFWRRYPSRVASLILCDTRAASDSPESAAQRLTIAERALMEGTEPIVTPMLDRLLAPETRHRSPALVDALLTMMRRVPPTTIALAQRAMANRADFSSLLEKMNVPALLIVGASDTLSTPAEMKMMADQMPDAEFRIIEDAGHLSAIENPTPFNAAIAEFLEKQASSSPG